MENESLLQFAPFSSYVEPSFWWKLTETKVDVYRLDDSVRRLWAYYSNSDKPGLASRLTLDYNALDSGSCPPANCVVSHGALHLANTIEDFRSFDKKQLLKAAGLTIWADIRTGKVFEDHSLLSRFILLCYIDAKSYQFNYWFAYPALCYPDEIRKGANGTRRVSDVFDGDQLNVLQRLCSEFAREDATGYYVLEECENVLFQRHSLTKIRDYTCESEKLILCFCDPSTRDDICGWPARNLIALWAFYRGNATGVRLLCWRQRYNKGKIEFEHSLLIDMDYKKSNPDDFGENLKVVGWEKNEKNQLRHRFADLSSSMDPKKLMDNAVDLNLKLMRWRLVPDLELDVIQNSSCLLFGAGTLGCNVARCCLSWGIRKFTFVDCGKVSCSNPIRQSLYAFDDCIDGGKPKVEAAVASMKRIFPNVEATGVRLLIPMPGHVIADSEIDSVREAVTEIERLVTTHDIIFLLVDTREGRWLPTLLSTLHSKITFSVALGFDSFVVVRHGIGNGIERPVVSNKHIDGRSTWISGDQLGCYFCADVTAPGDSSRDRTLDQQCTVARPAMSMISSALAVEMAVSLLQHPLRGLIPAPLCSMADESIDEGSASTCLGYVPHQIRGFASRYQQLTTAVQRFPSCIACSSHVTGEYRKRGFDFLLSVFNDSSVLESLTGLDELKKKCDQAEVLLLSDCESE